MIEKLENNIICITFNLNQDIDFKLVEYKIRLNMKDLILCLPGNINKLFAKKLNDINLFQNSINMLFIVVPLNKYNSDFSKKTTVISTKKEAIDYIYFENAQRQL
jgi:hypothetical protein